MGGETCRREEQDLRATGKFVCVADETKPRYSPSANQRPKACSVLSGFSLIGSYWLLHMAVLSCTVIGRVAWNHRYAGGYVLYENQIHKTKTTAIKELSGEA